MDLILWRHAEAVQAGENQLDYERQLTRRGLTQAQKVSEWLNHHKPKDMRILVSPTKRTQQTARALTSDFETVPALGPESDVVHILAAADWPNHRGAVLLVGHQPGLGRLASLLLSGSEANWSIKKGAVWWFSNRVRHNETQTILRAMITPEIL